MAPFSPTSSSLGLALSVNLQTTLPDVPAISTCLKGKPFLLLLDDVRERLDLAALGLPTLLGRRQKVIFTTRNHQICDDMGCQSIQMECLSEDDAWNLFKDKVGQENNIDAHPHIKHLAKKVIVYVCFNLGKNQQSFTILFQIFVLLYLIVSFRR